MNLDMPKYMQVHKLVQTLPNLRSSYIPKVRCMQVKFAHVGITYTYGQLYMYRQGSPSEIHIPNQWNMIRHSWNYYLSFLKLKKVEG